MAPLGKAISFNYSGPPNADTKTFRGDIDPEWTVGNVPNGGYVLALVLEACILHQASTPHRDPIHVSAHFLQATSIAPFEVRVRTLRRGRGFTNVLADLVQQDRTRITTHLIFGCLEPPRLVTPSSYVRRLPLYEHVKWAGDPHLRAQNAPDSPTRTTATTIGGGGLVWGAWFALTGRDERVTPASIAFLADTFLNLPSLLPRSERGGLVSGETWFPTMTLSIEFKAPIPPPSARHAARTGRHDAYVEIWTAPSELGEGKERGGWREEQFCLATATQMALSLPMEVNAGRAKYDAPRAEAKAKL
ncbi:thioesterase-like superfamily-domain-containing protein [Mycena olivaceomarginata]|nr:thioesterase-like superfamily-domain-containing protein [Mycena olivaceomarginata]